MRRVILEGYYGRRNAGDDAFLAVTAWGATRFLGFDAIAAHTHRIPATYGLRVRPMLLPPRIGAIPLRGRRLLNRWRERWFASRSASVVFGGGSIVHSTPTIQRYLELLDLTGEGPHYALGIGVGPFRDETASRAAAQLLERCAFVGVRDRASFERAREIAPKTHVELTFDLAPLLARVAGVTTEAQANVAAEAQAERRGLGIALRNPADTDLDPATWSAFVDRLAGAIMHLAERRLLDEVVLIDLNADPELGDDAVHAALGARLGRSIRVHHVAYHEDPVATLAAIAGVRALVAMRLHAAIFGFCARTPTVILSYHEKCDAWARLIEQPSHLVHPVGAGSATPLDAAIEQVLESSTPGPRLTPEAAEEQSLRNFIAASSAAASS